MKNTNKKRLVLASSSLRRITLLKMLGYHFDIIPHSIDEYIPNDAAPEELVQNLAFLKANEVAGRVDDAIVIGADTLVFHNKDIVGKPKGARDAKRILSLLSNSEHSIFTGVCIIDMPVKKEIIAKRTNAYYNGTGCLEAMASSRPRWESESPLKR